MLVIPSSNPIVFIPSQLLIIFICVQASTSQSLWMFVSGQSKSQSSFVILMALQQIHRIDLLGCTVTMIWVLMVQKPGCWVTLFPLPLHFVNQMGLITALI
jgi:hypothetical protein